MKKLKWKYSKQVSIHYCNGELYHIRKSSYDKRFYLSNDKGQDIGDGFKKLSTAKKVAELIYKG